MSNLPEGTTDADIDRFYGDDISEIEQVYEGELATVMKACSDAWQTHPESTVLDAHERWMLVTCALLGAGKVFKKYVALNNVIVEKMAVDLNCAYEDNKAGDLSAFRDNIVEYMGRYKQAVERDNEPEARERDK